MSVVTVLFYSIAFDITLKLSSVEVLLGISYSKIYHEFSY